MQLKVLVSARDVATGACESRVAIERSEITAAIISAYQDKENQRVVLN